MDLSLYQQLRQGAAAAVPLRRALWRLTGPDRARYLNGQVTNDVTRLALGKTLYAAVTSTKGRMIGDIFIGAAPDALYVDAALELRETLAPRLEKYLIADNAAWEDLTDDWTLTHYFGAEQPVLPESPAPSPSAATDETSHSGSAPSASRDSVIDTISDTHEAPLSSENAEDPNVYTDTDEGADSDPEAPTAANVPHLLANARFGLQGWDLWQPLASTPASVAGPDHVPQDIMEALCIEHGLAQWGVDMREAIPI